MMTLNERLMSLCDSKIKLAEIAGVSKQSVTNWIARDSISKKAAERIAKHFNIGLEWLLCGSGDLELKKLVERDYIEKKIPLISWVQAGTWSEIIDNFQPGDAYAHYPCPEKHSSSTFALTIVGESMYPDFIPGEIIYVDPEVEAQSGSCVVIRQNGDTETTFKQLMLDGSKKYLKALNPNWPNPIIEMLPDAVICGVVIGSYRKRN
jgi:SOS-response transcriptional repressor LexA